MKIALWTTLLEPLATEPKICISRYEHRYALSEEVALSRPVFRLWKPTSLILYSPEDLLSKLTLLPSETFTKRKGGERGSGKQEYAECLSLFAAFNLQDYKL